MKLHTLVTLVAATAGVINAHPSAHGHHHHHHAKRVAAPAPELETIYVYELNGHSISAADVEEGLRNGTLILAQGGEVIPKASAKSSPAPVAAIKPVENKVNVPVAPAVDSKPVVAAVAAPAAAKPAPAQSGSSLPAAQGTGAEFPDGELDCSDFPSAYGAMAVDYLGLGGWTGIQKPNIIAAAFDDIFTVTKSTCDGGACCSEGSYCSYACPAGFQKAQWPTTQGLTGQSIGGIHCKNGKLWLTNPSMSKSLCMTGATEVPVYVKNTMGEGSAICRTDYPGTESETVPLDATPGSTNPLTCPDADNYFNWQGKHTSAQYYLNPKGVSVEDGCQWGTAANPWGNFAPMNLGVGYSAGSAWLSIFGNQPTTDVPLDYNIEIVGTNGGFDNLIGRCKYQNGKFYTGDNYQTESASGCTVNVPSGSATYVLSN